MWSVNAHHFYNLSTVYDVWRDSLVLEDRKITTEIQSNQQFPPLHSWKSSTNTIPTSKQVNPSIDLDLRIFESSFRNQLLGVK